MAAVQPDVVLSFLTSVNVLAICASAGLDARVVVSERVDPRSHRPYGPWGILRDFAYRHADVVVAQTEEAAEWFRVRLRGRTRVEAIANPVGAMNPPPEADHSIPKPFILSVGRLVHQKGFDVLIRAFEIAAPDLLELHLAIVGEGETEHELRRQIAGAGLGARISLLGRSAAVPLLMKDAVALVMPSRYEGFPNVLLEALANRLPIVSTDCPSGPREILRNGEYGLLAPVENPHALAAAIVRIVRDTDLRHRFAELGPVAASRYDVAAIIALWERVLSR